LQYTTFYNIFLGNLGRWWIARIDSRRIYLYSHTKNKIKKDKKRKFWESCRSPAIQIRVNGFKHTICESTKQ
jgi:hypothetical protein